ncbi:MAG: EVE domain-containing protein, partial [Methanophagales archaeon]|nr:EVE domain-containing protein [Methanophagales archaeon]
KEVMNYWLCVANEENWGIAKEKNIWGVSERHKNQLNKVEVNDLLVFYLRQEKLMDKVFPSRISGIFKAVSKAFKDEKKIFSPIIGEEIFPYRVKLEPVITPKEPVEFKPLIQKLDFITNKKVWASHLLEKAIKTMRIDAKISNKYWRMVPWEKQ